MKSLRSFTIALAVFLCVPLAQGQSIPSVTDAESGAAQAQPNAVAAQAGTAPAPVKAIVTDGETGAVIPDINLTFTTIDVPGAGDTIVQGINMAEEMVGLYTETEISPPHGFQLSGGNFTYLDYLGAYGTAAYGINDSGLIAGEAQFRKDTAEVGFLYDGTTFTPIRDGKNSATICLGLNNAGWVVGGTGTVDATHGFELRGQTFKPILPPGNYVYIFAAGINNFGHVVGWTDYDGFS